MKRAENCTAMKKSCALYTVLLIVWVALTACLWWQYMPSVISPEFYGGVTVTKALKISAQIFLVLNALFITYFWLNGVKDFVYVIWYYISRRRLEKSYLPVLETNVDDVTSKVAFVYCTCNDFDGKSLLACMGQSYKYADFIILDDSYTAEYIKQVDEFAKKYNVKVVRRKDRKGFKAGNLNNFLMSEEAELAGYEYFAILDSDEIIPADFVKRCLKYFRYYSNVGIVQGSHVATRNRNFFMKLFHIGVNSHWNTYQTMKHRYGFSSLLGHGAMVSMQCYRAAGGFPEMVAEDLCLSITARGSGYVVAYAPDIVCEEEYPIDYAAFKKRHSKWTQGNMEFIKRFTGKIVRSKMKWYEKLDIALFTYNLPLTAIFALFIVVNIIIFPLMHVDIGGAYPLWMLIPTVIFFVSPMLNDIFFWLGRLNFLRLVFYCLCEIVLYGSMFFITFVSSLFGLFGKKAVFVVTPKRSHKVTFLHACASQYRELIFSVSMVIIAVLCAGNIWQGVAAVAMISLTGILSVFLPLFSNKSYSKVKTELTDMQTSSITIGQNRLAYK